MKQMIARVVLLFMSLGALTGAEAQTATYTVGGSISGLAAGKTVVLKNNTSTLPVSSTSSLFTFPAQSAGTSWNVSVALQPSGQTCTVSNPSGTNINANVTNVVVTCINTYTVGGTVSGLTGASLVLRMGTISLVVSSGATTFKFASGLKTGTAYNVLAAIQPPGFSCSVASGVGVIATANITNVAVTCVRTYTISGTVSGLTASGLTLRLTYTPVGASSILVNKVVSAGVTSFAFSNGLKTGSTYQVEVITQPTGLVCQVLNGSGTIVGANVTNVAVTCTDTTYTVSGSISGLTASGLSLSLSGSKSGTVSPASGATSYAFTQTVVNGNSYTVTITAQPTGQTCTLSPNPATGTVGTTNIVVNVTCTVSTYTIAVTNSSAAAVSISGSTATNATNPNSATSFNFSANHGDAVVLSASKTGNTCSVVTTPVSLNPITGNATATVSCTLNTYTICLANPYGATIVASGSSISNIFNAGCVSVKSGDVVTIAATKSGYACSVAESPINVGSANVILSVSCIPNTYSVGGTVSALGAGKSVVLQNNSDNNQTVTYPTSTFSFSAQNDGSGYNVTVLTQPVGQTCVVSNGIGMVAGENITNVSIICTDTTYTVSGSISGLNAGACLVLLINGKDTWSNCSGLGSFPNFSFPAQLNGSIFNVTVLTQPVGQTCVVFNGSGTIVGTNVTDVTVTCTTNTYALTVTSSGGTVTSSPAGINCGATCTASYSYGTSVTLTATPNTGATFSGWTGCDSTSGNTCTVSVTSAKSVTASFTYPVTVSKTGTGSGTVTSTPTGISCGATCTASYSNGTSVVLTASPAAGSTFSSWSGCDSVSASSCTVSANAVRSVTASFTLSTYTVSGTVSGLGTGKCVVLQNNGANDQTVCNPPSTFFPFPAQNDGFVYNVTIKTQPVGQTCQVFNGSGTLAGSNVANVSVTCTDTTYTISGSITGLSASGLSLSLSGSKSGTVSPVSGATSYAFTQTVVNGNSYTVTIGTQPTGQTCTLSPSPATGTVGTNNIVVDVTCAVNAYTIAVTNSSGAAVSIGGSTATNATNPNSATSFGFSAKHGDAVVLSATKTGNTCTVATTPASINPITGNATATVSCTLNTYTVGGTNTAGTSVSISGTTLTGQADTTANPYSFNAKYGEVVTLTATKAGYTCSVAGSPITVGAANVTTANVSCTANTYTISGTTDGAIVTATGSSVSNIVITTGGNYSLSAKLGDTVTLTASKNGYTCAVSGSPITLGAGNITGADVTCLANTYTVGGQNTLGASVTITGSGYVQGLTTADPYSFSAKFNETVTLSATKTGYDCTVDGSPITIGTANITNANVACVPKTYTISGTTNGTTVTASGSTVSNTVITNTGSYSLSAKYGDVVTLSASKVGYSGCVIAASPITVSGDATRNVSGCTLNTYTITVTNTPEASVSISGSTATNATNPNSATSFSFSAKHGDNLSFSATKVGYDCTVAPVSVSSITDNTSVSVTCMPLTIGGVVSGLGIGKSVTLLKTIGNDAPSGDAVGFSAPTDMPAEILGAGNYGWSFSLVGSQKVSALGLYNNDLNSDVQVGLWNSSGNLLASGNFSQDFSGLDLSDLNSTGFVWLPITEINLGPGLYTVGAYSSTDHFASYNVNVSPISGLTINKYSLVSFSSVLELPADESYSGAYPSGFFGPNIKFSGTTATNQTLNVASNGGFYFPTPVSTGDAYTVTVGTQPVGQYCEVLNGVGVVGLRTVTTVQVNCTTNTYSIVVTNSSTAAVTISGSGATNATNQNSAASFTFNANYGDNVSLAAMKTGNTCSVATTPASLNPITGNATATVSCTPNPYTITVTNTPTAAVSISGSTATNATNPNSAASFTFNAIYGDNVSFSATKMGYTCTVTPASINPVTGNATATVGCTLNPYMVGGTNADGASVTISGSSISGQSATSANPYSFNAKYGDVVTLTATKTGYTCSVAGSPITVGAANATTANVSCTLNTYVVSVNNIQGAAVTLTGSTATGNTSPNSAASISFNATHGDTLGLSAAKTGYTCTVTPASITSIAANSSASVSCTSAGTYTVSGKLTGNTGTVTLLNNGTNSTSVLRPKGTFSFSSGLGDGSAYNVTVSANPTGQICLVLNGSGVIAAANITNVLVSCTTNTYTLGGTVSGLGNGLSVVLLKNGSDALSITANGSFTFASPMAAGAYVVSIGTQPLGQSCVITNGSGTVGTTNITNITVTCSTNVSGCSSAGNAGVPSSDPFWAIYSAPTSPGVDTTPLVTSELPNLFQSCLQGT